MLVPRPGCTSGVRTAAPVSRGRWLLRTCVVVAGLWMLLKATGGNAGNSVPQAGSEYATAARPLVAKYCLGCHSTKLKKGSLDLERFASTADARKDLKVWQQAIEMLEAGEMPPKSKPQPTADERKGLVTWIHGFLEAEARARAGDPGYVPLRRLSNAQYDCTIRDLTGVDLRPTREFPADGAGGEGFTNAAEALSEISPALLTKYLNAAKEIADHAVLLPDGFRFSPAKTRRDWTDESLARLRQFFAPYTADGRLNYQPYLAATVRHREALSSGKTTIEAVAAKETLNAKYLGILWQALSDAAPSYPLDQIRTRWRQASDKEVPALAADVAAWQAALWRFVPVGSYRYGNTVRQLANDPAAVSSQSLKLTVKPAPGQSEVVLYLVARESSPDGKTSEAIWDRPRFEGVGKPLLLRDYAEYGPAYEVDYPSVFADCAKYLAAAAEAARNRNVSCEALAVKHRLDAALLKRWTQVLAVNALSGITEPDALGRPVPAVPLTLLDEQATQIDQKPAVNGWRAKGSDLPILMTNASDTLENVPGRMSPRKVAVHPMPREFVAAVWESPLAGTVRVSARVAHAHPVCGNGVAWWVEHRRALRATALAEGAVNVGGTANPAPTTLTVAKGDQLMLAIDAHNGDHSCDLTEIAFTVSEIDRPHRVWDLAGDVCDTVLAGNPHADKHGNKATWSFVRGPSRPTGDSVGPAIPADSVLGRWRAAAADPARQAEANQLGEQVQALLSGPRPAKEKDPDRVLYDSLVSADSVLFQGVDAVHLGQSRPKTTAYGLTRDRFDKRAAEGLVVAANSVTELHLPAALFRGRSFVVEARTSEAPGNCVARFQVVTAPPAAEARWDGASPVVASAAGTGYKKLLQGHADFRRCFPHFICFPRILPDDEVVCLKMFHREDGELARLFLDADQARQLDRLWLEHRFISQQPVAENNYLPQFIGFVTQDQPKELVAYFEGQREAFRNRAEDFERDVDAAVPKQLEALLDFASRAYRRPLEDKERAELLGLFQTLRGKGVSREEAFRGVLARVLVSPAFLFRVEQAPPGKDPGPVNDWELATRLSYWFWSSVPDDELRRLAAAGRLHEPQTLAAQAIRMLKDDRIRAQAVEFGTQWIHVHGFDEYNEKNERLFPTFDAKLRQDIYEESIRFFQDLFQNDRTVTDVLDADYAFLNESLAKHYGIPGVSGPEWRRVDGVKQYGRGGILGFASVQAKQAGASRTSPVLRGNWVVETLLGEKLPRPPANVPRLPEEEGGADGLTMRQQVEKHDKAPECAVCHKRIDPFGFALEQFDPIGRRRAKDSAGLTVDAKAKLKDGTEFEGIDGLRTYLLTTKRDVFIRLFCKRLLGYALGRAVSISDQTLVDEMVAELNKSGGRISAAVLAIVRSPQFRMVRGSAFAADERSDVR
jgi:hypothetical protein